MLRNPFKQFKTYFEEKTIRNWDAVVRSNKELEAAVDILNMIERYGATALIVGGAVRDLLLGDEPHDVDIATNMSLDGIENLFNTHDIGKSKDFNIVAVNHKGFQFEIANFREESGTTDNRHPDEVKAVDTFDKDAARRDITINSLGLTRDGVVIDYQNGIEDLENKIIRTVGDPQKRFVEDALRLIRALRFASKFGFKIDPPTRNAIENLRDLIDNVSQERIRDELFKIAEVGGSQLAKFIEHLDDVKMLEKILPEVKALQGMEQPKDHHPEGDAYQHTIAALNTSRSKDPITNLAILFHDIGKATSQDFKNGVPIYYGHQHESGKLVDQVADRLKLSGDDRDAIKFVADNHMIGYQLKDGTMKKSKILVLRNNPYWEHLKDTVYADIMSRGLPREDEYNKIVNTFDEVQKTFGKKEAFEKKMSALVNGRMIMDLIPGIKGVEIGRIKNQTRDWVVSKNFKVTPEEVNNYIKKAGMMNER